MPKAQREDDGAEDAETTITPSLTGSQKLPYCIFWQNQCCHNITQVILHALSSMIMQCDANDREIH